MPTVSSTVRTRPRTGRHDNNITGTFIQEIGYKKYIAYADDTAFFPTNTTSIQNILDTFKARGEHSGAKINIHKSSIMGIGQWQQRLPLSIHTNKSNETTRNQILPKSNKQKHRNVGNPHIAHRIPSRQILTPKTTIFGRSIIVNTHNIPKLIYTYNIYDPRPPNPQS
jgi:hypothetical protein